MQEETLGEKSKYSVFDAVAKPIWTVSNHWGFFWASGTFFAVVLTALSYIFGQTFICLFNPLMAQQLYCDPSTYLYLPYLIVKLIVLAVFIGVWNARVFEQKQFDKGYFLTAWRSYLRIFLLLCFFIFVNLLPALSGILLLIRVPNPVWQIEVMYFTVVATGFIAPFILMRFYAAIAEIMDGIRPLALKTIWSNTRGKGFKIVFSTAIMFMVIMVLLLSVNSTFQGQSTLPAPVYNFLAEMVFNIVTLLIIVFMVGFLQGQKKMILPEATDVKEKSL